MRRKWAYAGFHLGDPEPTAAFFSGGWFNMA
jgi:hypothetical protein